MTNFDRLVLDVETNGAIEPGEAISSAGKTLRELMGLFADMGEARVWSWARSSPTSGSPDLEPRSRRWISRSVPAAFAVPRSRRSVNWWSGRRTISSTSPTWAEEPRRGDGEARRAWAEPGRRRRKPLPRPRRGHASVARPHTIGRSWPISPSSSAPPKVTTTLPRAWAVRPLAEKLITKARKGDLHAKRTVMRIPNRDAVVKLFDDVAPRYADRQGGYTRITKLGFRVVEMAPKKRSSNSSETESGDFRRRSRRSVRPRRCRPTDDHLDGRDLVMKETSGDHAVQHGHTTEEQEQSRLRSEAGWTRARRRSRRRRPTQRRRRFPSDRTPSSAAWPAPYRAASAKKASSFDSPLTLGVLAFGVLTLTDLAAAGCGDTSETVFAARFGTVRRLGFESGKRPPGRRRHDRRCREAGPRPLP